MKKSISKRGRRSKKVEESSPDKHDTPPKHADELEEDDDEDLPRV